MADTEFDTFDDPAYSEPPFEPYEPPPVEIAYGGPAFTVCPWDGSCMAYVVFSVYYGYMDPPEQGFHFECQICGWEDEIS